MKPQELRIGNYVKYNQHVLKIKGINSHEEEGWQDGYITSIDEEGNSKTAIWAISPIPLTEEWLLNFRFSYFEGKYIKSVGNGGQIHIEKTLNNYLFESYTYHTYFKNVHELQNLYYVLTKKELTLTE